MIRHFLSVAIHVCFCITFVNANGTEPDPTGTAEFTVSDIVDAWAKSVDKAPYLDIQWRHANRLGVARFSQFQSHWAAESLSAQVTQDNFVYRIRIDNDRFRFDSQRWASGPHCEDFLSNELIAREPLQYTAYLQKRAEVGYSFEYSSNLHNQFANPKADFLSPQLFSRICDGDKIIDTWHPTSKSHARVTIRKPMQAGSVAWARLTPEADWNDQVDTLDMQAAMLALRRIRSRTLELNSTQLRLRPEPQRIDGVDCLVMDEIANIDSKNFRTFWIDPKSEFVIRRFIGSVAIDHSQSDAHRVGAMPGRFGKTQIDIDYELDTQFGWKPVKWSVSAWPTHDYPLFAFCQSQIIAAQFCASDTKLNDANFYSTVPNGAWVVDENNGEQHIFIGNGVIRSIPPEELSLKPTHADLLRTKQGELLIREWENPGMQIIRWSLALLGFVLLCSSGVSFACRRSRHKFSALKACEK
ncbi:MAG: hypothetical protein SGI77_10600 [Pirellulaceae bacterium]|nr:hypothetical protein [Pirellulaceae bacterium]